MQRILQTIFTLLLVAVLVAKILGWFLDFNESIDKVLNTAMFTLIGIAYIVLGFTYDNKLLQLIILTCGVLLIVFNFLERKTMFQMIGIVCILIPLAITRLYKKRIRS